MSANWSMRSKGSPYFAAWQRNLGGMDQYGLGAYGAVEMEVTFKLNALPPAHSDPNEIHGLLCFSQFLLGYIWLMVGVTPNGRFAATVRPDSGGPIAFSSLGAIVPDGLWHTLYALWDGGTGDLLMRIDGETAYTANSGFGGYASPTLGEIVMFNGADGLARSDVSIRDAWMSFSGASASSGVVRWKMNEKYGRTAGGTKETDGSYPLVQSFGVEAGFRPPLRYALPYGAVPASEPGTNDFGWEVHTDHTDVTPTPTVHTEVAAT